MRGIFGVLVGIVVIAIGLAGLGYALDQMMTHADPDAALKSAAGLGTFVVVGLASSSRLSTEPADAHGQRRRAPAANVHSGVTSSPSKAAGYHGEPSAAAGFLRTCISCAGM